ncbi:PTS sugar transporter subunit IIA [Mycobacterium tuberculosis]|uniref:PTS sugar transporter subunit IIA n=1 Tax=Mycobacterium tuberculosis TaxID=1773 RepID=UPI0035106BE6
MSSPSACRALITDSLFARERLGSTGLGHGVAIPHGRIKGLKAPMAAVLQLAQPIGFDAPDEQPVSLRTARRRSRGHGRHHRRPPRCPGHPPHPLRPSHALRPHFSGTG